MTIKEYHAKHVRAIRAKTPLTQRELLKQIKDDYEINRKDEVERAYAIWQTGGEIVKMANAILENRTSDNTPEKRIFREYFLRNRLLSRLFPEAHDRFKCKWDAENFQDMLKEPKTSPTSSTYVEWLEKLRTGKANTTAKKPVDKFTTVFKGMVDEI